MTAVEHTVTIKVDVRITLDRTDAPRPAHAALDRLTPRERDVLAMLAEGRSNTGIAAALTLSESAVAKHINSIFTKLNIPPADGDNRRVLAALQFLRHRELP